MPMFDGVGDEVGGDVVNIGVAQAGDIAGDAQEQAPVGHVRRSQRTTHLSRMLKVSTFIPAITVPSLHGCQLHTCASVTYVIFVVCRWYWYCYSIVIRGPCIVSISL